MSRLFESRVIKIDWGIINVEVRGIFGIGCLSCYHGMSGLNVYSGAEKRGRYTAPLTIKLNGLPLSNMPFHIMYSLLTFRKINIASS